MQEIYTGLQDKFKTHPATRLHILRGISNDPLFDKNGEPYDPKPTELGTWENVLEHTLKGVAACQVLSKRLGLTEQEQAALNLAFYVHDSGKQTERAWQLSIEKDYEPDDRTDHKTMALSHIGQLEEWENAEVGIPPMITNLSKANIPPTAEGYSSENPLERLMHFVDLILAGDKIVPVNDRFDALEQDPINGNRNIAFSESFKPRYNGRSLYDVQRALGSQSELWLLTQFKLTSISELYEWLRESTDNIIQNPDQIAIPTV